MNESISFLRNKYGSAFPYTQDMDFGPYREPAKGRYESLRPDFMQGMNFGGSYSQPAAYSGAELTPVAASATEIAPAIPTKDAAKSLIQAAKDKEQPDRFWINEGMRLAAEAERRKALEDADRFSQGNDNLSSNMAMLNAIPGMANLNQQQAFRSRGLGVMAGR